MVRLRLVLLAVFALTVGVTAASASGYGTPFKVSGPGYSCSGSHVVNSQVTKDSETCFFDAGSGVTAVPGKYVSSPCLLDSRYGCIEIGGIGLISWFSDYAYNISPGGGAIVYATSWTLTIKAYHDGSETWTIEAIF